MTDRETIDAVVAGLEKAIRDPECPVQFSPLLMEARKLLSRSADAVLALRGGGPFAEIRMAEVKLCAGEGKLNAHEMLAACNAVIRLRNGGGLHPFT